MFELIGDLVYEDYTFLQYGSRSEDTKEIMILYPENKGIYKENNLVFITNYHLVEKTLIEMFFGIKLKIDLKTIYDYELEKDALFKVMIRLDDSKDVKRFFRKNKIKNLLETNNEN